VLVSQDRRQARVTTSGQGDRQELPHLDRRQASVSISGQETGKRYHLRTGDKQTLPPKEKNQVNVAPQERQLAGKCHYLRTGYC
jgi:hypothetical protein